MLDKSFIGMMNETAKFLCENIQGAKFAYVQSDEISLLLTDFEKIIQEYVNKFEDVKDDDYTSVVNWLIETMTPRDVVKFTSNIDEELSDWDNKEIIERIVDSSVKELYQYV